MSWLSAAARRKRLHSAYQFVFGLPEGKLVLHDLLRAGFLLGTTHVIGDSHMSAFNEGKRVMALEIIQKLRWTEAEMEQLAYQQTASDVASAREDRSSDADSME